MYFSLVNMHVFSNNENMSKYDSVETYNGQKHESKKPKPQENDCITANMIGTYSRIKWGLEILVTV